MSDLEWKTPKGTVLHLMLIKGKRYLQVSERMIWFREEHPDWGIKTSLVHTSEKETVAHAEIINAAGLTIATAHKAETKQGFADHLEKAETGAIGRALAMCGYGTQFCGAEFDEGERLADAPSGSVRLPIKSLAGLEAEHARELQNALRDDAAAMTPPLTSKPVAKPGPAFRVPKAFEAKVPEPIGLITGPGDYISKIGQPGGKILGFKIKDIKPKDLADFMKWLRTAASSDFLSQSQVQDFIRYAEDYLNDLKQLEIEK